MPGEVTRRHPVKYASGLVMHARDARAQRTLIGQLNSNWATLGPGHEPFNGFPSTEIP